MGAEVQERRRTPRYAARLPVTVKANQLEECLFSAEVGLRGVFLLTDTPRPQRQLVTLLVTLPDGSVFNVQGMVARSVDRAEAAAHGIPLGMAIQFYGLNPTSSEQWEAFLDVARQRVEAGQPPIGVDEPILPAVDEHQENPQSTDAGESQGSSEAFLYVPPPPPPRGSSLQSTGDLKKGVPKSQPAIKPRVREARPTPTVDPAGPLRDEEPNLSAPSTAPDLQATSTENGAAMRPLPVEETDQYKLPPGIPVTERVPYDDSVDAHYSDIVIPQRPDPHGAFVEPEETTIVDGTIDDITHEVPEPAPELTEDHTDPPTLAIPPWEKGAKRVQPSRLEAYRSLQSPPEIETIPAESDIENDPLQDQPAIEIGGLPVTERAPIEKEPSTDQAIMPDTTRAPIEDQPSFEQAIEDQPSFEQALQTTARAPIEDQPSFEQALRTTARAPIEDQPSFEQAIEDQPSFEQALRTTARAPIEDQPSFEQAPHETARAPIEDQTPIERALPDTARAPVEDQTSFEHQEEETDSTAPRDSQPSLAQGLAPDETKGAVVYRLALPNVESLEGFVDTALKKRGVFVTTADIRPSGTPAVVCIVHPISNDEFHLPGEIVPLSKPRPGVAVELKGVTTRTLLDFATFISAGMSENRDVRDSTVEHPIYSDEEEELTSVKPFEGPPEARADEDPRENTLDVAVTDLASLSGEGENAYPFDNEEMTNSGTGELPDLFPGEES